ncbi:DUF2004 domain-containing protein [Paenibacillus ferrarius]|uniref:DUF2004 domain-containing protein n=1 Tax=Paenibacillus ferrarius TaxID=1469647 RepID=A0A1V4HKB8_9BACL|nr:DUF2004 domain-containing protein [Paenibacillus ferrarius]OPH57692.1 DUF2004 domain-containing protein [Paenibacillus ferrarius]
MYKVNDAVFGELSLFLSWSKATSIDFCSKLSDIELIIDGEEDGKFDQEQYDAYLAFMENWETLQYNIVQSILDYYIQRRHELGYDVGHNEDYPLIDTAEQLLKHINLDGIIIKSAVLSEYIDVGLTFSCSWDDENGLGVKLLRGQVVEVGWPRINFPDN